MDFASAKYDVADALSIGGIKGLLTERPVIGSWAAPPRDSADKAPAAWTAGPPARPSGRIGCAFVERPTAAVKPKFPLPQEGIGLIFLTKACLVARAFWLQGEGDPQPVEGALLERGRHRDFVELDRRV